MGSASDKPEQNLGGSMYVDGEAERAWRVQYSEKYVCITEQPSYPVVNVVNVLGGEIQGGLNKRMNERMDIITRGHLYTVIKLFPLFPPSVSVHIKTLRDRNAKNKRER